MISGEQITILKENYNLSEDQIEVLISIHDNEELRNYFFKSKSEMHWFKPLIFLEYFKPENQPQVETLPSGEKIIQDWDVLYYLDNITKNVQFNEKVEIQKEVLQIIKDVSKYNYENNIHSHYIYYYFTKFLTRIDKELIDKKTIELIRFWNKYSPLEMIITSEITENLLKKFVNEKSSDIDISKAELILKLLLELRERDNYKPDNYSYEKYDISSDYYWIGQLMKDENFLDQFSLKCSYDFFEFLKNQITKTLIVQNNHFTVECNSGTLKIVIENKVETLCVKVYLIENVRPTELRFDFITKENRDEKLILEFECNQSDKNDFVENIYKNLLKIEVGINDKELVLRDLSFGIYTSLYSRKTYDSLYDNSNDLSSDALEILNKILKKLTLKKSDFIDKKNIKITKRILNDSLNDKYMYFKKLYLYVCAKSKNDFMDIFWDNISKENINGVIFEGLFFGDELKHFFKKLTNLSKEQIKLLKKYFERGSQLVSQTNEFKIQWKQRLYAGLKHIPEFNKMYEKYLKITKIDYTLSAAILPSKGIFYDDENTGISPFSEDELFKKKYSEIVKVVKKLENDKNEINRKKLNGLTKTFKNILINNPLKWEENLTPFLDAPDFFISNIFIAFQEFMRNKKTMNPDSFINFIKLYFESKNWVNELSDFNLRNPINPSYIFYDIYSSFREMLRNNFFVLTKDQIKKIKNIIVEMINYRKFLKKELTDLENEDYLTISINSSIGNIIEAYILCLRLETISISKEKKIKWKISDKRLIEKLIKENIIEIYSMFGYYINLFVWFDKVWTLNFLKRSKRLHQNEIVLWKAIMNGYMWNGRIFLDLYEIMLNNYELLLETKINDNEHSSRNLIIHISVGYLNGLENINKGLFGKILENSSYSLGVINYFWSIRETIIFDKYSMENEFDRKACKSRIRVLIFWRFLFNKYNNTDLYLKDEDKICLSNLSRLTCFLFELNDKTYNWIFQTIPYIYLDYNTSYFIEYLNVLKERGNDKKKVAELLGNIYIKLLENSSLPQIPTYKEEAIFAILKYVKDQGFEDEVNKIYDLYIDKQYSNFALKCRDFISNSENY